MCQACVKKVFLRDSSLFFGSPGYLSVYSRNLRGQRRGTGGSLLCGMFSITITHDTAVVVHGLRKREQTMFLGTCVRYGPEIWKIEISIPCLGNFIFPRNFMCYIYNSACFECDVWWYATTFCRRALVRYWHLAVLLPLIVTMMMIACKMTSMCTG